jgi:HK97 gp10 family phage protein
MAGIETNRLENLRRNIEHICNDVLDRAVKAAEDAAARVIKEAVEASAPRRTGRLTGSIIAYESVDRKALAGSGRKRLLVGPEKSKGFYGYFYNFGRKGQAAQPWFETASASVEAQAMEADIAAFQAVIPQELER